MNRARDDKIFHQGRLRYLARFVGRRDYRDVMSGAKNRRQVNVRILIDQAATSSVVSLIFIRSSRLNIGLTGKTRVRRISFNVE